MIDPLKKERAHSCDDDASVKNVRSQYERRLGIKILAIALTPIAYA